MNIAAKILAASDLPPTPLAIPEWGVTASDGLYQRGMNGQERCDWERMFVRDETGKRPEVDFMSPTVGWTLIDISGKRIFSDEQIAELSMKSAQVIDRLYDSALKLSGIRTAVEDKADLKNSEETSGSVSVSG